MLEQIILGIIQGIAEWLPVSSEGIIVLIKTNFFEQTTSVALAIKDALYLHLGTFFAALIYFRKDVALLAKALFKFSDSSDEIQKTLRFLIIATLISGIFGVFLVITFTKIVATNITLPGKIITMSIGLMLLVTGAMQLKANISGLRAPKDLKISDAITLGFVQGLAALPGLSRSGLTVTSFLLLRFDKAQALRLSFLMSLPIVLLGNIVINVHEFTFANVKLLGILFAFIFGLATIHILFKIAQKVNFGYFVLGFGILTIISSLI